MLLFRVENEPVGYSMLALSLVTAAAIDREFMRHLALVAAGMVIISLVPLDADLSIPHMMLMGGALALAVLVDHQISGEHGPKMAIDREAVT